MEDVEIIRDKNIKGGVKIVKGTRVTIKELRSGYRSGMSMEELSNRLKEAGVVLSAGQISKVLGI